jgi:hypothetical protein
LFEKTKLVREETEEWVIREVEDEEEWEGERQRG